MTTETKPAEVPRKTLVQKLAAVMAAIKHVPKRGRNDFHKYDYATEADIADAVRDGLAAAGIMLIPDAEEMREVKIPRKSGGEDRLVTLKFKFTLTDGIESLPFHLYGEGQDAGDKATYKATTGATKYALLKLFLIPTGDDPEKHEDEKPAPRTNGKASADAATKVRAAAAKPANATPIPGDSLARKADLFSRLKEMGIPGAKMAEQLGEWLGRPVDKDTVFSAEDWTRAVEAIRATRSAGGALVAARANVEAAFNAPEN